jgi:hypothetical protein
MTDDHDIWEAEAEERFIEREQAEAEHESELHAMEQERQLSLKAEIENIKSMASYDSYLEGELDRYNAEQEALATKWLEEHEGDS